MTNRERFKAIARFERPGDLWVNDMFWQETLIDWAEQGAPPQLTNSSYRGKYFGFDHSREAKEIVSGLVQVPYVAGSVESYLAVPPIVPQFEPRVIEEDRKTIILVNQAGQTVKILKDDPQKMPMYLDHPVKDRQAWNEYKKRLYE